MDKKKAYALLNISIEDDLTYELLRKQYLKASLKYHPDKNKDSKLFIDVKNAYDYLLEHLNELSPLFYLDEKYTHTAFHLFTKYIYKPFEKHIHSYSIYELNPNIDKLLNKELYYMKEYDIYVPLWHHELWYDDKKIKIKIKPILADYISIDIYNNIHIYLEIVSKNIDDIVEFKVGSKSFSFIYKKIEEHIIYEQGIPILQDNIFEYNTLSNIIVHI